jgi:hypothetical protein
MKFLITQSVIVLSLLLSNNLLSQDNNSNNAPANQKSESGSKRVKAKRAAIAQIKQLRAGALLVRLHTNANVIEALRKKGKIEEANVIERKQKLVNAKVVAAFKAEFRFCPTYFFFSTYSKLVSEKQFEQVSFVNDSLETDSKIKMTESNFFTAELGEIEQDTAKYLSEYTKELDGNGNYRMTPSYIGGANPGFEVVAIKSDRFVQLRKPFPFYVRTYSTLFFKRSLNKTIKILNRKLNKYYENHKD